MLAAKEGKERVPSSVMWLWYSFQLSFHKNNLLSINPVFYGIIIGLLQNPVHYTYYKNITT